MLRLRVLRHLPIAFVAGDFDAFSCVRRVGRDAGTMEKDADETATAGAKEGGGWPAMEEDRATLAMAFEDPPGTAAVFVVAALSAAIFLAARSSRAAASRFNSFVSKDGQLLSLKSLKRLPSWIVVDSRMFSNKSVCCRSFAKACQ